METMLADKKTYEILKRDPTSSIKKKLENVLKRLREENKITQKQYEELYPTTFHMPRIYGSPKIHKPDCPLRPIVEGIGSVTYNAQKFLKSILKPIEGDPEFFIKDSKDLVQVFGGLQLEPDETLLSHDVVGLFTNVSIILALEITQNKLEQDRTLKKRTKMTVADIIELLTLILNTTYFSYNGKIRNHIPYHRQYRYGLHVQKMH